ncbi:MAG: hypothetical protein K8T90_09415 [Planctomycetes bacterium]|nr:hypothetical protein [Planctomycetota bacterium]
MLADRTLLGVTLVATFAAGGMSGWAARDHRSGANFNPTVAAQVYAPRIRELKDRGYDENELKEALTIHQQYLDAYQNWWKAFLDAHSANLDQVDRTFETRLSGLEQQFRLRTRADAETGTPGGTGK